MCICIEHEFREEQINTLRGFKFLASDIHPYVYEYKKKKDQKEIYQNYIIISIISTIFMFLFSRFPHCFLFYN